MTTESDQDKNKLSVSGHLQQRVMPLAGEIERPAPDDFKQGDYVTRDGTDIHYVEKYDSQWRTLRAVCIIAPSTDWAKPGEMEDNMIDRYCRCNRHFLTFAKAEHKKLKKLFPDGWVWEA